MAEVFDIPTNRDGLTKLEAEALTALARKASTIGKIFVEIGSWKGHSSSILGKVAKEVGGTLYCVDHWKGSPGSWHHSLETDCFSTFRKNIKEVGLEGYVYPLVMDSDTANDIFANDVASLIFIDGDHWYRQFVSDIHNWWPKVRIGGYLCGHDCEAHYRQFSPFAKELIDISDSDDYLHNIGCHPGVVKGMNDCFDNRYTIIRGTTIWVVEKIA